MGRLRTKGMGNGVVIFAVYMNHTERLRLAFAAIWSGDRSKTWSGTPFSLQSALQQRSDIYCIDTPVVVNRHLQAAARLAFVRRIRHRWLSQYRITPPVVWGEERGLRTAFVGIDADVALLISDLGVPPIPFMTYFDHTFIHLEEDIKNGRKVIDRLAVHTPGLLKWRTKRQVAHFRKASALISMSHWEANALKASGMVDPNRVFVVPPGRNVLGSRASFEDKSEYRFLFVGRDFLAKGGEQVVRAFARLRSNVDYPVTLVVAGPVQWPLKGPVPEGVEFVGDISYARVHSEMQRACVFVMPSVWEAYGIVFLEAMGEGLPVIGRKVCAMPEIITHGVNGLLLEPEDHEDVVLAEYMHRLCTDIGMRKRIHDAAESLEHQISWERAANDMVRIAKWCVDNELPAS